MKPQTPEKTADVDAAVRRLVALNYRFPQKDALLDAEMLLTASNAEEFDRMRRERVTQANFEQTLLRPFRHLFMTDENVKVRTLRELQGLGVEDSIIKMYFVDMGEVPSLGLRMYGESRERGWAEPFIAKAREVMFKTLKEKISKE